MLRRQNQKSNVPSTPKAVAIQVADDGCVGTSDAPNIAATIVGPNILNHSGICSVRFSPDLDDILRIISTKGNARMRKVPSAITPVAIHISKLICTSPNGLSISN